MSGDPTLEALETEAPEETGPDPAARVLGWRIEQLLAVGFDSDAALVLALDRSVDLHEANDATAFCEELVAAEGVLLLPGAVYDEPTHVRVGFGRAAMPNALERLERFIDTRS